MDTRTSSIRLRLARVRDRLRAEGLAAVLVPSSDPHLSEYLPGRWQGRQWLSGFTGSMGTLAVTLDDAALFADSRYWTQAERELEGSGIDLVKLPGSAAAASQHVGWLAGKVPRGGTVGVDGSVLGLAAAAALRDGLERAGVGLRTDIDVFDGGVWDDRPLLPEAPVREHLPPHATTPRAEKLARVREAMRTAGATHHLVSTVDDVAWLFNLRGSDVDYNPVFLAHALIGPQEVRLFVGEGKVDAALRGRLESDGVRLEPYAAAGAAVAALPHDAVLLLDPKRVTQAFRERVPAGVRIVEATNPSTLLKSRKTDAEAAHVRRAMEEDGAAMCAFYAWFERALAADSGAGGSAGADVGSVGNMRNVGSVANSGSTGSNGSPGSDGSVRSDGTPAASTPLTELTVDERLTAERARRAGFVSLSFPTIAGFAANGAMPHYRATPASHAAIDPRQDSLLLIDSGAQYLGGTTDITRVWPIGTPSPAMRSDYTRVLKGTIALSRACFPRGTLSPMLDSLARAPLWAAGLDYGHGTGHGVGYFLNVHEGPQSISKAPAEPQMAMEPGMITSVEPGLYRPGRWGIRIENLVLAVPAATREGDAFGEFLEFETLTLCPIDTRLIDRALLADDEAAWLDAYHADVRRRLTPLLEGDALAWLLERTEPLGTREPVPAPASIPTPTPASAPAPTSAAR